MSSESLLPPFTKLTQDSREAAPGVLFFAIEGGSRDGHDFLDEVLAKGAAVVARRGHPKAQKLKAGANVVVVDNPRLALGEAAAKFYGEPSKKLKVCGVTGTNGKTTSTYLLEALLEAQGLAPAVIGTVENRFGDYRVTASHTTPDAVGLQRLFADFLDRGARSIAMEVSSHALDQLRVAGTVFEAALFTNLTQDHLDYHGTMEEYFQAKVKFFTDYDVKIRAIHVADTYGQRLAEICRKKKLDVVTFGAKGCNVNYDGLRISADGIRGTVSGIEIKSPLIGGFNAQNLAGAIAVAVGMGIAPEKISAALSRAKQVPGRMETVPNTLGASVVVDYAHSPDALEKALKTLRALCTGKLLCVFGCGGDRDPTKRPIMGGLAEELADEIFVTSDNPRTESPEKILDGIFSGIKAPAKAHRIVDRKQAIGRSIGKLGKGDILLIAGKGHEDYQIIGTVKHHFDDRVVAAEFLASR